MGWKHFFFFFKHLSSSSGLITRLSELPCCSDGTGTSKEDRCGRARLRHGDLHGLQHLLNCLRGAFVLLGPATGQLHVRRGRWKAERRQGRKREKKGGKKKKDIISLDLSAKWSNGERNTLEHGLTEAAMLHPLCGTLHRLSRNILVPVWKLEGKKLEAEIIWDKRGH